MNLNQDNKNTYNILIQNIAEKYEFSQKKTKEILDFTFDEIISLTEQYGTLKKYQFGSFSMKYIPSRNMVTPLGKEVTTIPKNKLVFKCSSSLVKNK